MAPTQRASNWPRNNLPYTLLYPIKSNAIGLKILTFYLENITFRHIMTSSDELDFITRDVPYIFVKNIQKYLKTSEAINNIPTTLTNNHSFYFDSFKRKDLVGTIS